VILKRLEKIVDRFVKLFIGFARATFFVVLHLSPGVVDIVQNGKAAVILAINSLLNNNKKIKWQF